MSSGPLVGILADDGESVAVDNHSSHTTQTHHPPHPQFTMHTSSETSPKHSTVVRFATFGGVGNEEDDVELQQQGGGGGGRIDEEAQPRMSNQNDDNNNAVPELSGASSLRESRSGRTARADDTKMVWSDPSTWFLVRKTGPDGKQTIQRSRLEYWNPGTTVTNSSICGPRHNFFAWYCNPVVEQEFLLFYYNDRRPLISGGINYIVISILWLVLTILNKHVNTLVVASVAVLVPLFLVLVVFLVISKRRIDAMNDAQRKQLEDEGCVPAAFTMLDAHDVARNEMRRNAKMFEIACCLIQLVECVAVLIYASFRSECYRYPQALHQKTCLNAYVSDGAALFIGFLWTQSRPARSFVLGPVMILFLAVLLGGRFLPIQLGVNWNQYYTVLVSYVTFFLAAWYGSRNRENWLRDAFERRVMLLAAQQQLFTLRAQLAALSLGSAASNNALPPHQRAIQSAAPATTTATQSPQQASSIQTTTVHSCLIAVVEWDNYQSWSAHQRNASVALSAWQQFVTAVTTAAKADLGSDVATSLQISALPYEGVVVVALPLLEGAASSTTVSQWFYCASTWASGLTASASTSGCCCSCDSGSSASSSGAPQEATVRVALHIGETQWNGTELTGPAVSAAKRLLPSSSDEEEEDKASLGTTSVSPHHQLVLSVGPTRTAADAQFLSDLYQSASATRAILVSATLALLARPLLLSPNSTWVASTSSVSSDSETGSPLVGLNNSQSGNPLLGKGGEASFGSRDNLLTPTGLYVGTPAGGEDSINHGTPQKASSVVLYPALCHGVAVGLFQVCPEAVAPRTTQQQQPPEPHQPQQPQPQPQATAVMSMTSGDEGVAFHHTSAKLDDGHEPSPKPSLPLTSDASKVHASSSTATHNATAVRKTIQLAVEEHDNLMDIPFNPCCERVPRYADPSVEDAYQAWYPESYQFGFVLCTYVVQIAASFTIVISMRVLDKVSSAHTIWDSYPWALASLLLPSWMLLLNVLFGERVPRLAVTLAQLAHYALYTIAVFAAPKGTVVGNSVAGWFFSLHLIANQNRARWYSAKLHFLMHSLFLTAFFFWILFKAKDPGEYATVLGLALVGFSWFMSIRGIIFIDGIMREGFTVVVALQRFLSRIATERQVLGQTLLAHAAAVFPSSVGGNATMSSPTVLTVVEALVAPSSVQLSPQSLFRRISQDPRSIADSVAVTTTTTSDPNDSLPPQKSVVADFIRSPSMRRLLLIVERRGATSSSPVELMQTALNNSNAPSTSSPSSPPPSPSILVVPLDETKVALLALNMTPDAKRAFDDIAGRVLQMTMAASDSWIVVVTYDAVALELHVPAKRFLLAGPAVSVGLALVATSSPPRVEGRNGEGCSTSEESPCARFVCTDAASRVLQLAQEPKEDDSSSTTTSLRGVLASLRRNNDAKPKLIDEWNLGKRFPTTKVLMY